MKFNDHKDFFDNVGDNGLFPKYFGECIWSFSVEEMYQHFKARMIEEITQEGEARLKAQQEEYEKKFRKRLKSNKFKDAM